MKDTTISPLYVDAAQAAKLFGLSLRTIRRLQASGQINSYKIGLKSVRFHRQEVEKALFGRVTPDAGGVH